MVKKLQVRAKKGIPNEVARALYLETESRREGGQASHPGG
jgi:hypothetical protein